MDSIFDFLTSLKTISGVGERIKLQNQATKNQNPHIERMLPYATSVNRNYLDHDSTTIKDYQENMEIKTDDNPNYMACSESAAKWHACMLTCFACYMCLVYSRALSAWHVYVLGMLHKNGTLGVLHKMACLTCLACLKLMKCFLDVFHDRAIVNCGLYWIK